MISTPKDFSEMAFGPWSTNDPKIQRTIVRTRASAGSTQRKFQATYPPSPTIRKTRTAITGGFEFAINVVSGKGVAGYNIYSSTTNNAAVANLIRFVPQPSVVAAYQSVTVQDITAASPFYWASSVSGAGKESARIPIAGTASPTPNPSQPLPSGSGGGTGTGGGGASGGGQKLNRL